jgi:hypothetical protein
MPLWLTQGKAFAKRKALWDRARASEGKDLVDGALAGKFLERESQSLEERYLPRDETDNLDVHSEGDPAIQSVEDGASTTES